MLTPTRNGEDGRQDETDDDHDDEQSVEDFGVAPLVQAVAEVKGAPGDREGYQEEDQFDQEARQAQQRAGSDGGGRVVALLLVEPHLRGQHCRVPAGQGRERVREFQTQDAAHRERTRNAAPVRSRAARGTKSRRGPPWPPPNPIGRS